MKTLFDDTRSQMTDSIRLTEQQLCEYGPRYPTWCVAWSGGKDSTTALTVVIWLIESGRVPRPQRLVVLYADTRQEMLPLSICAASLRDELDERNIECRTVMAPLDRRMWVYILGRGVPPPNNNTLRYCTRMIKIEPMEAQIEALRAEAGHKVLAITGVRIGESAARDQRIALACSRDGAECGQGRIHLAFAGNNEQPQDTYFVPSGPDGLTDTLAPILHWRVCHVWEWLYHWAPTVEYGDWSTRTLAEAYGGRDGDEAQEIHARTGCVCCPLASRDTALDAILRLPRWEYLWPLKRIRRLYEELRLPHNRLRKHGEILKDGRPSSSPYRMGPITLEARRRGLEILLGIQAEVNAEADRLYRPRVDHINEAEEVRIRELIAARTWPNGWTGEEPGADEPYEDGSQPSLFSEWGENP